jgi:hypothetical protein
MTQYLFLKLTFFVGNLIVLISWVIQNYFFKKWESKISDTNEKWCEINRIGDQYDNRVSEMKSLDALTTINNNNSVDKIYVESIKKAILSYLEMEPLIAELKFDNKSEEHKNKIIEVNAKVERFTKEVEEMHLNYDKKGLIDKFQEVKKEFGNNKAEEGYKIYELRDEYKLKKKKLNNIFLYLFIIGTLLMIAAGIALLYTPEQKF